MINQNTGWLPPQPSGAESILLAAGLHTFTMTDGGNVWGGLGTQSAYLTEAVNFSVGPGATVSAVPIPAALPMFGAALVGLGGLARRRARKAA